MNQDENEILELSKGTGRRGVWQAWAFLLTGLIAIALATHYIKMDADGDAKRDFDFICKEIQTKILDRLSAHEQILRSGAAFFVHPGGVSREDWRHFAERQKVDQQLPGTQGIGFQILIPRENLAQHVQEIRAQGFPQYQVWPEGERESYSSVIYLEPFTNRNLRAFGYDALSEPVRRTAMERARDLDAAALSGKVTLLQETDTNVQAGTLMYVPVYRMGMPHDTIAQRRDALVGWVYSPYRMNDLMQGILQGLTDEKRIHLEVFDSETVSSDTLLYNSQPSEIQQMESALGLALQSKIVLGGHAWTLRFTQAGTWSTIMDNSKVWLALFGGTSTSLLLIGLFISVLNTRSKALRMARELTNELAQSERSYRDQFASNSAVMFLLDPHHGAILDANAAAVSFYGYPREKLLAMRITDINTLPPAEVLQTVSSVMTKQGQRFQFQHRLANGELRDVEVSVSRIQFGGRIVFHSIIFDVTKRKQLEQELQENHNRLASIIEGTNVGTWRWNVQTGETEFNERWAQIVGYTLVELAPSNIQTWISLAHPDDRKVSEALLQEHFAGNLNYYDFECRMRHKNGQWVWVQDRGKVAQWSTDGRPLVMTGTHTDITVRKRVEDALHESRELLSLFMRHSPIYAFIKDATPTESRVLLASENFHQMLGPQGVNIQGRTMADLYPPDLAAQIAADDRTVIANGQVMSLEEDFNGRNYNTIKYPIVKGGKTLVAGYIIDITERKQLEAQQKKLESQNRQLQKSESLGRMAAAIAHHFNNQLQAVMMNLEVAINDLPKDVGLVENLTEAKQSARRAADVSTQMLTYLGQTAAKHEPLYLSETCQGHLPMLRTVMPQSVVLKTDLPSPGPVINANAHQIQQILTSLLTNAWEAMGEDRGVIRLTIKTVPSADIPANNRFPIDSNPQGTDHACLEVADTGCGIKEQDIERIFDPFFTTKFTGRGLGLAVVLGIVRAHGGVVTVESRPNNGSVFRIFLPLSAEAIAQKPVLGAQAAKMAKGSGTILVIDDEPSLRKAVTLALKRSGFAVLTAVDGVDAVEVFQQHRDEIDCVLSDLTMPRMNGWETLTALRKLSPGIPVILCSGYSEAQVMAGDHTELPHAFLSKPYELMALKDTIVRIMKR